MTADRWRLRYLGPWTWHTHGDRDGWAFPRRHFGWRLIVTAGGQRIDVHGSRLRDVLTAARHRTRLQPIGHCDRCLPGLDGERIPIYLPGETPCEHTRSDR